MASSDPIHWYDTHARELSERYRALAPEVLNAWLSGLLPDPPAVVVDIGAGTGRDAAMFASNGYKVIAVEPSGGMRAESNRCHPESRVRWIDDRLPTLQATLRLGIAADLVLLSAVWMHILPEDRPRAFRKTVSLLKPGGLLAMTLRVGPDEPGRSFFPVPIKEVERLAHDHGMAVVRVRRATDLRGRADVSWVGIALRRLDDNIGVIPLPDTRHA